MTGVEADGVEITQLTDSEGTAELGMRKSKLITVYDLRLTMAWQGAFLPSGPLLVVRLLLTIRSTQRPPRMERSSPVLWLLRECLFFSCSRPAFSRTPVAR